MTFLAALAPAAAPWQNFYLLVGTAAATLIGLMFVSVTFGSSFILPQDTATARAFLDPTLSHFVQVLFSACLVTIPGLSGWLLGTLVLLVGALRGWALLRVYRKMKAAQAAHNDLELSDWLMGIVLPVICYSLLVAIGVAFIAGYTTPAFDGLALVTLAILFNGIYGSWELLVWMALTRSRAK